MTTEPLTEEERAARAESDAKAARDFKEKREARRVRVRALKTETEAFEDKSLALWAKLEERKLDLGIMGESPRGVFLRDEAKKLHKEYVELRKMMLIASREMGKLLADELADMHAENRPMNPWGPLLGGFLGGLGAYALANLTRGLESIEASATPVADTLAPEVGPPTEPAGGGEGGENPSTPLGDSQNAP